MGNSGRQMLEALMEGSTDTCAMAQLAQGKLRAKIPQLERALRGCSGAHQRFLIAQQLAHIDFLEETIERLSAEIAERMRPFEEALERLETIPGKLRHKPCDTGVPRGWREFASTRGGFISRR
jgi:transposase